MKNDNGIGKFDSVELGLHKSLARMINKQNELRNEIIEEIALLIANYDDNIRKILIRLTEE